MAGANELCSLCNINKFKYVCPKCSVQYCSLKCYKSEQHIKCSELFYKNCCKEGMTSASKEIQDQIEQLLAFDDSNNLQILSLEERLADLDMDEDTDKIWQRLTDTERNEFYSFIQSDDVKKFIKCWKPWWIFNIIEEVDSIVMLRVPCLMKEIIPIGELISTPPNPLIRYSVIDIVICYSYITRRFNGDHHLMFDESVSTICEICASLMVTSAAVPTSVEEVIGVFILQVTNGRFQLNNSFLMLLIDDLFYFLKAEQTDRHFIAAALSDLRSLLKRAAAIDRQLRKAIKKLEFFISWIETGSGFRGFLDDLRGECEIAKMINFRI